MPAPFRPKTMSGEVPPPQARPESSGLAMGTGPEDKGCRWVSAVMNDEFDARMPRDAAAARLLHQAGHPSSVAARSSGRSLMVQVVFM